MRLRLERHVYELIGSGATLLGNSALCLRRCGDQDVGVEREVRAESEGQNEEISVVFLVLGYLKLLQMGNTDPNNKSRKRKYEVKPQYEELSKQ
ncbi:transcriptional activator DEMETER-like [Dorcoceras hygrometricum]|uniref:Transcriptional activator DEMETER-like n=1 Tax=Dorcoceras hygrometricum TaxID=472368 RepID=A0A2Z7C7C3_9LAMI|nr:transcriptional activator DEMETER-like [Dorcoceras hygrometricum]